MRPGSPDSRKLPAARGRLGGAVGSPRRQRSSACDFFIEPAWRGPSCVEELARHSGLSVFYFNWAASPWRR